MIAEHNDVEDILFTCSIASNQKDGFREQIQQSIRNLIEANV